MTTFFLMAPDGQTFFTPPMELEVIGVDTIIFKTTIEGHAKLEVSLNGREARFEGDLDEVYEVLQIDVT